MSYARNVEITEDTFNLLVEKADLRSGKTFAEDEALREVGRVQAACRTVDINNYSRALHIASAKR